MYYQDIYYTDKKYMRDLYFFTRKQVWNIVKAFLFYYHFNGTRLFLSNTRDDYTSPHGVEPQSEALLGDSVLDKFTVKGQGHEVWTVFGACPLVANYIPATSTWIQIRRIYFFPISFPSEFM